MVCRVESTGIVVRGRNVYGLLGYEAMRLYCEW